MAHNISNNSIEAIYEAAKKLVQLVEKLVVLVVVDLWFFIAGNTRYHVMETLASFGGVIRPYSFTKHGLKTWTTF
jgi:D-glycero-alpha-D-manno-heptose-7-phosphate kinase